MAIGPSFSAYGQSAEVVQPGDRPFRHPALAPQALRGLDPFAGQAGQHMPSPHGGAMGRRLVGLVRVQFVRPTAGSPAFAANRRHGVDHRLQGGGVARVRRGQADRERDAAPVHQDRVPTPRLARSVGFFPVC